MSRLLPPGSPTGVPELCIASGNTETFKLTGAPGVPHSALFPCKRNDRWQRMTVTGRIFRDKRRPLICIFADPATRRMRLRSIPDRAREHQPP